MTLARIAVNGGRPSIFGKIRYDAHRRATVDRESFAGDCSIAVSHRIGSAPHGGTTGNLPTSLGPAHHEHRRHRIAVFVVPRRRHDHAVAS